MAENEDIDYNTRFENEAFGEFAAAHSQLREKYRVKYKVKKKDLADWPNAKVGDFITRNPDIPATPAESFKLFKEYYGQVQFLLYKSIFFRKYKVRNKASVVAELTEMDNWIAEAKKLSYSDSVNGKNWHSKEHEYLRLINGFYEGYLMTWEQHRENSTAATIYGKYILLYNYLRQLKYGFLFTNSRYVSKIDIDYEDLPDYVVRDIFIRFFEGMSFNSADDAIEWNKEWTKALKIIPEEYLLKTIEKALEYVEKVYEYHLANECYQIKNGTHCAANEAWERRISFVKKLLADVNLELNKEQPAQVEQNGNPEFTTARQVLAVHYLLEYCQVTNIDNTAKARFIQFLTGKETGTKGISNTNIYKKVIKPFSSDNKTLNNDLAFIRKFFEDLGLHTIASSITKEISKSDK